MATKKELIAENKYLVDEYLRMSAANHAMFPADPDEDKEVLGDEWILLGRFYWNGEGVMISMPEMETDKTRIELLKLMASALVRTLEDEKKALENAGL